MAIPTTSEKRTAVCGLGEIALRVNNLDAMQKFYEEVIAADEQRFRQRVF